MPTKSLTLKKKLSATTVVKRKTNREVAIFVDGVALDRACRRLEKRISLTGLLQSLSAGVTPAVARYYTIVPYEDDSRQRAFLDAVERSGFEVVVKRLPPKNVDRTVSTDIEVTVDMLEFSFRTEPELQSGERLIRSVVVVCPSPDLSYPLSILTENEIETTTADFGSFVGRDPLKSSKNWIDLTDSQMIWL